MESEIYIDLVFLANFFMDYVLLCLVGRFFQCRNYRIRKGLAAAAGSLYTCLMFCIPGEQIPLPGFLILHGACGFFMVKAGLGLRKGSLLVRGMLLLYLAAILSGGIWELLTNGRRVTWQIFSYCLICTYLLLRVWGILTDSLRIRKRHVYPTELTYRGRHVRCYGLYDSGNMLEDPFSHMPVSVCEVTLLKELFSSELVEQLKYLKEKMELHKNAELTELCPRFVPYHSIDRERGLLLTITLDELSIDTQEKKVLVSKPVIALLTETDSMNAEYEIILNSRLII